MGKRELLIALLFALLGTLTYWATGRPATETEPAKHTLPSLVDEWRGNDARSAARGSSQSIGSKPLERHVSEIRVSGFTKVHVVGSARDDVSWTLRTEATGTTAEGATQTAQAISTNVDDLGGTLAFAPSSTIGSHTTDLALEVPSRMAIRVAGVRTVEVDGVEHVRLDAVVGDASVRRIAGTVTGAHRNGALAIETAGAVDLALASSRATIGGVVGSVRLTARNGATTVTGAAGSVFVDATNVTTTIVRPTGTVGVNATGGATDVVDPREAVQVDGRRSRVGLTIERPVGVTIVSVEGPVSVALGADVSLTIDAVATVGTIDASALGLVAESRADGERLQHVGGSAARLSARVTRATIVITRR